MRTLARKQESSVRHLQALYSVVAGGALFKAAESLSTVNGEIRFSRIPLFICFLLAIIPFYHGAMRHLDDAYLDETSPAPHKGALLADFTLLFLEGCLLLTLAITIQSVSHFPFVLLALLALDAVWAVATFLAFQSSAGRRWLDLAKLTREWATQPQTKLGWAAINIRASLLLLLYVVMAWQAGVLSHAAWTVSFVLGLSLVRTTADYRRSWTFYFPGQDDIAVSANRGSNDES